jgi:hypothetical protein
VPAVLALLTLSNLLRNKRFNRNKGLLSEGAEKTVVCKQTEDV